MIEIGEKLMDQQKAQKGESCFKWQEYPKVYHSRSTPNYDLS